VVLSEALKPIGLDSDHLTTNPELFEDLSQTVIPTFEKTISPFVGSSHSGPFHLASQYNVDYDIAEAN